MCKSRFVFIYSSILEEAPSTLFSREIFFNFFLIVFIYFLIRGSIASHKWYLL